MTWWGACGRKVGQESTAEDTKDIKQAVDNVFAMPFELRRFGVLLQSIPDRGENCLARRLADWCYGEMEGRYAYALDNLKTTSIGKVSGVLASTCLIFWWRVIRRLSQSCLISSTSRT
ncbi:hypothetical protein [Xylella fastidiosa]|uniref:hypothetical protein n=1 Tax=Xylella fastidiosa TaxID=2371 RepID=UPI003AFB1B81